MCKLAQKGILTSSAMQSCENALKSGADNSVRNLLT